VIDLHHRGHRVVEGAVEPLEGWLGVEADGTTADGSLTLDATARLGEPQLEIVGGWPRL
jgi:hypothetical protein